MPRLQSLIIICSPLFLFLFALPLQRVNCILNFMSSLGIEIGAFVRLEGFAVTDSVVEHARDAAVDIGVLLFRYGLLLVVGLECCADHLLDVCFQGQRWTSAGWR